MITCRPVGGEKWRLQQRSSDRGGEEIIERERHRRGTRPRKQHGVHDGMDKVSTVGVLWHHFSIAEGKTVHINTNSVGWTHKICYACQVLR